MVLYVVWSMVGHGRLNVSVMPTMCIVRNTIDPTSRVHGNTNMMEVYRSSVFKVAYKINEQRNNKKNLIYYLLIPKRALTR